MKKQLLFLSIAVSSLMYSQKVIFSQDFNDTNKLDGWGLLDRDRDGNDWEIAFGSDYAESLGWDNEDGNMIITYGYQQFPGVQGPVDPDNLILSPAIEIPAEGKSTLTFKIGTITSQISDINYQLFIIEDGQPFYPTLTPVEQKNFTGIEGATTSSIDLSAYKGKTIRIFWRMYDSFAQYLLLLDDVKITHEEGNMGVDETMLNGNGISIYPNPVSTTLNIKGIKGDSQYSVYNAQGEQVLSGSKQEEINVEKLPQGVYVLVVKANDTTKSFKFIKK
ncbi:T9SS-dependent choice-of-anchor J family protein [Riemerella columbipharyngis]|uniref:Por secretion system C-terminal sorting domain-containing protein n=1 Tax=Riemerella columbipharyngis TaxID=1071918 RepID=A0A1G6YPB5_9FLAO|nr:T9SS type A sorting domain-containing protein [Riemerella columbipharyngis]SDD92132.1 Por secretion system C-terminal sorting domain-containing protein [Riemerella columbipharyngis]